MDEKCVKLVRHILNVNIIGWGWAAYPEIIRPRSMLSSAVEGWDE
jgi:hypothetical protein